MPRILGDEVADVIQRGRIPEQFANAIEVLLLALAISKLDRTRTYRETSKAREVVDLFLSRDSPLPPSIDRGPELLDSACFPEFYRSYLGGDDLTRGLCRLLHATTCQSGRLALNAGCRKARGLLAD